MESNRGMYVHPLALVVLVATIAVLLTVLVMRQSPLVGGAGLAPVQGSSSAAPAQPASGHKLYYSAMHPWIVQDHPGTCPICGMDLVEMPPEEQAEYEANHPEPA